MGLSYVNDLAYCLKTAMEIAGCYAVEKFVEC